MKEKFYTLAEMQEIFRISKPTALKLVHSEGFPKLVIGKRLLIPCNALKLWCIDNTEYRALENLQHLFNDSTCSEASEKTHGQEKT